MALPTNKMSEDKLFTEQGAITTERSENERAKTVVHEDNTNIAQTTEDSENKRAATVKKD